MKPIKTIDQDDIERWKLPNGAYHRVDGPAVIFADGHKEWWVNGKLHRTDGPAVMFQDGTLYWYLNGKHYTEQQFNERTKRIKELEEILKGITT